MEYVDPQLIKFLGPGNVGSPLVRPDRTHAARAHTTDAGAGTAGGSSTPGAAELKAQMQKVDAWQRNNNKTVCGECGKN